MNETAVLDNITIQLVRRKLLSLVEHQRNNCEKYCLISTAV